MIDAVTRRVLVEMFREEWRLHGRLFSGRRFAAFPVLVALLVTGATGLLVVTDTSPGTVLAGLHALAFVFGLHTGSIGFVGRDALRDVLGDLTLLVFSARTLPLSRRRLLGVFVAKDAVYYALLFLLPMAVGALPALLGAPALLTADSVPATVVLLWATLTLAFVLGLGATIAGLGITRRGVPGTAVFAVLVASIGAGWLGGLDVAAYTPYGAFLVPSVPRFGALVLAVAAVFAVAAVTFDPAVRRPARTVDPAFRRWSARLGDPVATRTLLDVHRSAGGFGKVVFSAAVLFGVTAVLVDLAGRITGVSPSAAISFGTVLGLSGFTTYNWLAQSDDVDSYLAHPIAVADVFAAKFRAFVLLGPIVGLGFYALALVWRGGPLREALVGAALLVGVACYVFGVTIYLTGLSPNEFLFDPALFAAFGVAVVVPLVPVLVVGFVIAPSPSTLGALAVVGVALGAAGVALFRRSIPEWSRRLRS